MVSIAKVFKTSCKITLAFLFGVVAMLGTITNAGSANDPELLPEHMMKQFAEETSGTEAKRNLDQITLYHRTRASRQYAEAVDHVFNQLKIYGFDNAEVLEFPADGKTMFGTQKSRMAWDVDFAELWIVDETGTRERRLASWDAVPLSVAQDSLSGAVTAELVDVGAGLLEGDYKDRGISGKLVLTSSQPGAIADLAVAKYGAAGIVSYAPNQKTAWWKQDDRLVRWGHLSSFPAEDSKTFAFMISLGEARKLQARMKAGQQVRLDAKIEAYHRPGTYQLITAAIEGSDPTLAEQEIAFTCHLDHPRPGANDNASGCVAILEAARAMKKMIDEGSLPAPKRTIRFIWPAEIEGSIIFLSARPDMAARIKANIHMDMVGGGLETKAVFRIAGSPASIPSFVPAVGQYFGEFVNHHSLAYASGDATDYPLVAQDGGREPLMALMEPFSMGSDHQIFSEGTWGIPGIYLHDWPDRYIHTNFDTAVMIDPTKLKRAAYIGATTAWYLANMGASDTPAALAVLKQDTLKQAAMISAERGDLSEEDRQTRLRMFLESEAAKVDSLGQFAGTATAQQQEAKAFLDGLRKLLTGQKGQSKKRPEGAAAVIYARNTEIKGPMNGFGYGYLDDKLDPANRELLKLRGEQAYEALNLVSGERTVQDIHDWMTLVYGAVAISDVADYLAALETIDVIKRVN